MMNKFMRVDDELIKLSKQMIADYKKKHGITLSSQCEAAKVALRKALGK